jgi:Lipocalin-like domain
MNDLRERIVGTWTLESAVYEDEATGERGHPLGLHPRGAQIATREGRWIAVVTAQSLPVPANDAERAAALRSMIAYTGRYRVEDDRIITKVEAAWNESWVGTEQVRIVRFDGDRLHLEGPPQPHPNLAGRRVRSIITWRREA